MANDRLIERLQADPGLAETHHRTTFAYQKGWPDRVHAWPYLLKRELLVTLIVTAILIVWSVALDAPLEEPLRVRDADHLELMVRYQKFFDQGEAEYWRRRQESQK